MVMEMAAVVVAVAARVMGWRRCGNGNGGSGGGVGGKGGGVAAVW